MKKEKEKYVLIDFRKCSSQLNFIGDYEESLGLDNEEILQSKVNADMVKFVLDVRTLIKKLIKKLLETSNQDSWTKSVKYSAKSCHHKTFILKINGDIMKGSHCL